MKLVINDPKTGNSFQRELDAAKKAQLSGKKIGDSIEGSVIGLTGYNLKIMGGSDSDGTPMRFDMPGTRRIHVVLSRPPGVKHLKRGAKLKKRVTGNTVSEKTAQLNLKIVQYSEKSLADLGFVPKPKEKRQAEPAKS